MTYIGRCKHGCNIMAISVEHFKTKDVAEFVSDAINRGYEIDRTEAGVTMQYCQVCCGNKKEKQEDLF